MRYQFDDIAVVGDISQKEAQAYAERAPKGVTLVKVETDGEWVNLTYCDKVPFERIRRVTGYLSSVARWNNGKVAELHDRVKHPVK